MHLRIFCPGVPSGTYLFIHWPSGVSQAWISPSLWAERIKQAPHVIASGKPETFETVVCCMAQGQELSGWSWANLESAKVVATAGPGVLGETYKIESNPSEMSATPRYSMGIYPCSDHFTLHCLHTPHFTYKVSLCYL